MLLPDVAGRRGLQGILQAGVALAGLAILWFASQGNATPATVAASLSVLALVAMPLQDLGAAWDRYCAWTVARQKAQNLLAEPSLCRTVETDHQPPTIVVSGAKAFTAEAGQIARLDGPGAKRLARIIAGLDTAPDLQIDIGGDSAKTAFIGDGHISLQGSLRRSVTLSARKRPKDTRIADVLTAFGLQDLLSHPRGLDQRISENGKGLGSGETLRLDLARAVLGQADLIVIASLRWDAEVNRPTLLDTLRRFTPATIILAESANHPKFSANSEAC